MTRGDISRRVDSIIFPPSPPPPPLLLFFFSITTVPTYACTPGCGATDLTPDISLSFFSLSLSLFLSYPFRRPDRGDGAIVRLETNDDDLSGLEEACRYSPPSDSACTILGSALLPSRNSSRVSLSSWFLSI